jgi:hypothetical protein
MALLGNYSALNKNTGRFIGGNLPSNNRSNWNTAASARNMFYGTAGIDKKNSVPNGYVPTYSWVIPQDNGGMASYENVYGSGIVFNSNLAGGLEGVSTINGIGQFSNVNGNMLIIANSTLSGDSLLSADIQGKLEAFSTISGTSSITDANANLLIIAAATILSNSTCSGQIFGTYPLSASISGTSNVTADLSLLMQAIATLIGNGTLDGSISALGTLNSTLVGSGVISSAQAQLILECFSTLSGYSFLDADIIGTLQAFATLLGTGNITNANGALQLNIVASLIGLSTLTGNIQGIREATALLQGNGNLVSSIKAIGNLISTISGDSSLNVTISAVGDMSATVTPFTELSPQGLAAYLWNALADEFNNPGSMGEKINSAGTAGDPWTASLPGSYTEDQAGHIIGSLKTIEENITLPQAIQVLLAIAAGKTTVVNLGGGQATVTFRDLNDTKDVVVATMNNSNRTSVITDID